MTNSKRLGALLCIVALSAVVVTNTQVTKAASVEYSQLEVSEVWGVDRETGELTDGSNGLYNTIIVKIEWLPEWAASKPENDPSKLILYLDGYPLKGLPVKIDQAHDNKLLYVLYPGSAAEQNWKQLLGRPRALKRPVAVTVGLEGQPPINSKQPPRMIKLTILSRTMIWVYGIGLLLLLVLFFWLAWKSNILRDGGSSPTKASRPFSLGRTQMAFWFLIVVAAYVFIWLATSAYGSLSASVLALIGISAGTALGAVIIDTSKRAAAEAELEQLEPEKATLDAARQAAKASGGDLDADKKTRLDQIDIRITEIKASIGAQKTRGFFLDILSDANGISFHRFQIAVWTVVLGFIFIVQVYSVLSMPDFPSELLALMGISGGTYLGFKFPEKQS